MVTFLDHPHETERPWVGIQPIAHHALFGHALVVVQEDSRAGFQGWHDLVETGLAAAARPVWRPVDEDRVYSIGQIEVRIAEVGCSAVALPCEWSMHEVHF